MLAVTIFVVESMKLRIGKPIDPSTFTDEKSYREWAAWIREKVYELEK